MSSFSYFRAGLTVVFLLVAPVNLCHWFADDGCLPMLADEGSLTKENLDSTPLHLAALVAAADLALYVLMIAVSHQAKDLVVLVYLGFMMAATTVQFTHPFTGKAPGVFEMPMPLLYAMQCLVFGGYVLDKKMESKKSKNV